MNQTLPTGLFVVERAPINAAEPDERNAARRDTESQRHNPQKKSRGRGEDDFGLPAQPNCDTQGALQMTHSQQPEEGRSNYMGSSKSERIKGGLHEAKGKIKEKAGEALGSPDLRDRGTAEKAGGKVQRKVGEIKKVFGQ